MPCLNVELDQPQISHSKARIYICQSNIDSFVKMRYSLENPALHSWYLFSSSALPLLMNVIGASGVQG